MFEKLGEMNHSRFMVAASQSPPYRPAGEDAPTAADCAGSLPPPKGCQPLTYGVVLEDVNRLSHLLDRFLETAGNSERRNGLGAVGANPAYARPQAGAPGQRGTSSGRSRGAAARSVSDRSLTKRESSRRNSDVSVSECAQAGLSSSAKRRSLKELMLSNGWDGFSGMLGAYSSRKVAGAAGETGSLSSSGSGESAASSCAALEPREHEWMLALAAGDWDRMEALLLLEPSLLNKKDFVTGLTAAHWLAKLGKDQALLKLVRLAESRRWPLDLNAKAGGGGYTALHLAAMQGHPMVIKLLVGAYSADVDIRDFGGRKAWQYLGGEAPSQLRQLTGAQEENPEPSKQPRPPTAQDQVDSPAKKPELSLLASIHRFFTLSYWQGRKTEGIDYR
ncbi:ankyrin repeat domain-containing protein SOWAHC [Heterodontus francisci]|uniref:ankyrin repeat domain-containing protein SOWAHC n=1 Tax=Heterodontus francisci TaxID=7792 RepID=UPI00355BF63B